MKRRSVILMLALGFPVPGCASLVRKDSLRVYVTHLNHSNPALDANGPQRAEIERRGFAVLEDSQVLPL